MLIVPGLYKVGRTFEQHTQAACELTSTFSQFNLWVIVGEWTPAYTDCAKYLNGRGIGARYDGSYPGSTSVGSCEGMTGTGDTFSQDYKTNLAKYWDAQVRAAWYAWHFELLR